MLLGGKMTAVRKVVDSSDLEALFDLPSALRNKKIEVLMFPAEEITTEEHVSQKNPPHLTMAQIEEWAETSEIQALVGVLKGTGLPENITMNDIRNERLAEKYQL
jgi:hypothetical protein